MKNIYLTSVDFIKSNSNISDNLQDKFIQSALREAQTIELQGILGTNLLEKIQDIIDNDSMDAEENAVYKNMMDKIQYYLVYQTIVRLCLISNVKISNGGLQQNQDENLTVLSTKDMFSIQDQYQNKADYYCKLLQNYLVENYNKIPEFTESQYCKIAKNTYSAGSTSIWLGGDRGKGSNCPNNNFDYHKHF